TRRRNRQPRRGRGVESWCPPARPYGPKGRRTGRYVISVSRISMRIVCVVCFRRHSANGIPEISPSLGFPPAERGLDRSKRVKAPKSVPPAVGGTGVTRSAERNPARVAPNAGEVGIGDVDLAGALAQEVAGLLEGQFGIGREEQCPDACG